MNKLFASAGLALACTVSSTGCVTAESISIAQIPGKAARTHEVQAYDSSPTILLIPFGTGFVEHARSELMHKCPGGKIEGLLTKHIHTTYFPILFATTGVSMQGYCVAKNNDAAPAAGDDSAKPSKAKAGKRSKG